MESKKRNKFKVLGNRFKVVDDRVARGDDAQDDRSKIFIEGIYLIDILRVVDLG